MAEEFSNIGTKQNSGRPKDILSNNEQGGLFSYLTPTFTTTAATVTTGTAKLIKIPAGTKIDAANSFVVPSAALAATSCTVNIGMNGTAANLASALNINTTSKVAFDETDIVTATSETWVIVTFTISGAVTAGVTLDFRLATIKNG